MGLSPNRTPVRTPAPRNRRSQRLKWVAVSLLLALAAGAVVVAGRTAVPVRPAADAREEESVGRLAGGDGQAPLRGTLREVLAHPDRIPSHYHPLLGRPAPDFELTDLEGRTSDLRGLRAGGPVVLVFYHTQCDLCTRQLFDSDRDLPLFRELNARVVAISADPPEATRRRFGRYGMFGFPVLSDPGNSVAEAYEVFRRTSAGIRADRLLHGTFVIDRGGTVVWANVGDAPFRRDAALLYQLAQVEGRLPAITPSVEPE